MPASSPYDRILQKIRLQPGFEEAVMVVQPEFRRVTVITPEKPWGDCWHAMRNENYRRCMVPDTMGEKLGLPWGEVDFIANLLIEADDYSLLHN